MRPHVLLHEPVRVPDGPDSPMLGIGGESRDGRSSRRLDLLSQRDFVQWLDGRPGRRSSGAIVAIRLREPSDTALDALAGASIRAVRPDDRVGRLADGTIAIWLDGLPPHAAEARADRLRLGLQRQGVPAFDLAAMPVATGDDRPAMTLLDAVASDIGRLERVPS
jgi:hypothetical protein